MLRLGTHDLCLPPLRPFPLDFLLLIPYTSFILQAKPSPHQCDHQLLTHCFHCRHFLSDCYFCPDTPTDSTPTSMRPILPHSHHNSRILEIWLFAPLLLLSNRLLSVCLFYHIHCITCWRAYWPSVKPTSSHFSAYVSSCMMFYRSISIHSSICFCDSHSSIYLDSHRYLLFEHLHALLYPLVPLRLASHYR